MAEYRLPHEIVYETADMISVADVIGSLLGAEQILKEIGPLLEDCIPGLVVEKIQVSIKEISEGSLKEVVWAAIFIAFQPKLDEEVPKLLEDIFGVKIGHDYPTIVTVLFLLILFYGADFVYTKLSKITTGSHIRVQLDGLIDEVSRDCKIPADKVRHILEKRYAKGRMRALVKATMRVFRPSKQHGNSAMRIGKHRIEPHIVAEIPGDAQMLEFDDAPPPRTLFDVEVELHAQDMDHATHGWAAVIPSISPRRVRMELYPTIRPIDIYTRPTVRADVLAMFRENGRGEMDPTLYYLIELKDQPNPPPPIPGPPSTPAKK